MNEFAVKIDCSEFLLFFIVSLKDNARLTEPILRLSSRFVSLSICCPKNAQKNSNFQTEIIMNHLLKKYSDISV